MNWYGSKIPKSLLGIALSALIMNIAQADSSSAQSSASVESVTFQSNGVKIVGNLYRPESAVPKDSPLVVILGPVGFVKEQAPLQYARNLAERGYAALIFDPRYHGQSGGTPRRLESGEAKTEDIHAAIDYAQTIPGIDRSRVHLLGICQGVNWIARAAANEKRVKSVGFVAGHYLIPEVAKMYLGGQENVAKRLASARAAKRKYEETGEVEYIPVVSKDDKNALLTFRPIYDWYIPWANTTTGSSRPGHWENRIARMSELDIWGGDITKDLSRVTIPTIMIHSDKAASGPQIPKRLFEIIPAKDKQLVWFEDQFQTMFYDNNKVIGRAVEGLLIRFDGV